MPLLARIDQSDSCMLFSKESANLPDLLAFCAYKMVKNFQANTEVIAAA